MPLCIPLRRLKAQLVLSISPKPCSVPHLRSTSTLLSSPVQFIQQVTASLVVFQVKRHRCHSPHPLVVQLAQGYLIDRRHTPDTLGHPKWHELRRCASSQDDFASGIPLCLNPSVGSRLHMIGARLIKEEKPQSTCGSAGNRRRRQTSSRSNGRKW